MKRTVILLACSISLSACARHLPHPASLEGEQYRCRLPVLKLTANEYDNPDEGAGRTYVNRPDTGASLIGVLKAENTLKAANETNKVLVLSGGGPHGAFGAGLFYGWQNSTVPGDEPIPNYKIITGVSTGALQSTFIFLETSTRESVRQGAHREADRLRTIEFLRDRMEVATNGVGAPGSSYLANLAQDYMPDRESDLLHLRPLQRRSPNQAGMLELIGHSSLATMEPLRNIIGAQIGDETLAGVAGEAALGRKLFVAMADLANGYGYAADLTKLAQLAVAPGTTNEDLTDVKLVFPGSRGKADRLIAARRCYTDALIASSTVPPGVPEVPIGIVRVNTDGHMASPDYDTKNPHPEIASNRAAADHAFIDGGAAFAVFFSQLKEQLGNLTNVEMDLVVNGSYYPQEWSKWLGPNGKSLKFEQVKVSAADVLLQSAEILQAQVRLFSVQEARRWAKDRGRFRWAFIDNRQITPQPDGIDIMRPWQGAFKGTPLAWKYARPNGPEQDCAAWREDDRKQHNPMEFFPTYMRCVVSYGLARGKDPEHRWNLCEPANSPGCVRQSVTRHLKEPTGGAEKELFKSNNDGERR